MAEIAKTLVGPADTGKALTFTATTGSDYIVADNADQRMSIMIQNGSAQAASFTLQAGNGCRAAAGGVTVTVPAAGAYVLPMTSVDSARVKYVSGVNAGKILIASPAGLQVAVTSIA